MPYVCLWRDFSDNAYRHTVRPFDEYSKAHLQVTQLNQMCDGTWAYPVKQSSATTLDEPVVIVCSNKPPEDVYPNFYFLVLARFRVFEL